MAWWKIILVKLKAGLKKFMRTPIGQFMLVDSDNIPWTIDLEHVHTIFELTYSIVVVYKDGSFKEFPNILANRANLPNIRLGSAKTPD
jgi:hypothetical protein